jgi:hypothetical protein
LGTIVEGGYAADFWMTVHDAKKLPDHFSFRPINPADPLYRDVNGLKIGPNVACYCLFFAWPLASSYETETFYSRPESRHTLSEVTKQTNVCGEGYDPTRTTEIPCGELVTFAGDGCIDCDECAFDCVHRAPCTNYTVSFHLKVEVWKHMPVDSDGELLPNPGSCCGDDSAPADYVGENDFTWTVGRGNRCYYFAAADVDNPDGDNLPLDIPGYENAPYWIFFPELRASCTADSVSFRSYDTPFSEDDPSMTSVRARETTIDGTYPDVTVCEGCDDSVSGEVQRWTMSEIVVTCSDVAGSTEPTPRPTKAAATPPAAPRKPTPPTMPNKGCGCSRVRTNQRAAANGG